MVTSQFKARSKVKIANFRIISYRDGTNSGSKPKLQKAQSFRKLQRRKKSSLMDEKKTISTGFILSKVQGQDQVK